MKRLDGSKITLINWKDLYNFPFSVFRFRRAVWKMQGPIPCQPSHRMDATCFRRRCTPSINVIELESQIYTQYASFISLIKTKFEMEAKIVLKHQ